MRSAEFEPMNCLPGGFRAQQRKRPAGEVRTGAGMPGVIR
jgi:hypothetical protein